jgi:hypothetical protein
MLQNRNAPAQVRRAFVLLWASFAASLTEGVVKQLLSESNDLGVAVEIWSLLVVAFAASAYLIYSASRRYNWARIALLSVTLITIAGYVVWPPSWTEEPWWSTAITGACAAADLIALYWLFSGQGRRWFETSNSTQEST